MTHIGIESLLCIAAVLVFTPTDAHAIVDLPATAVEPLVLNELVIVVRISVVDSAFDTA
jgi:hypothetical protein